MKRLLSSVDDSRMSLGIVGTLHDISNQSEHVWKVPGFSSLRNSDVELCYSPLFQFKDAWWYMKMYPNGVKERNSEGWLSLYLMKADSKYPTPMRFSLTVELSNGKSEVSMTALSLFEEIGHGWGRDRLIESSELLIQLDELKLDDVLTVKCSLKMDSLQSLETPDCVASDLMQMFSSAKDYDVVLQVQDIKFHVHRCILAARSPTFAAVFDEEWLEAGIRTLVIDDFEPEAFDSFLLYLYSEKLKNPTPNSVFQLYAIADKFEVEDLKFCCVRFINRELTAQNVFDIFIIGERHGQTDLLKVIHLFFNENCQAIFPTAGWKSALRYDTDRANRLLKGMAIPPEIQKV